MIILNIVYLLVFDQYVVDWHKLSILRNKSDLDVVIW